MELRRLRYFIAVAEEQNFTRASHRLRIAQPALSKQVRQLEAELGVILFDRSKRAISLTEAGALLLDEANRILQDIDQVSHRVHEVGSERERRISIHFQPSVCSAVLPLAVQQFRSQRPDVQLTLREGAPDAVTRALERGLTDVGFINVPLRREGVLRFETLLREPLVAALPESHRLARANAIDLSDLASDDFILNFTNHTGGLHGTIVRLCHAAGYSPRVVQEAELLQTTLSLVSAGLGVTLVAASMRGLQPAGVAYKTIRDCPSVVELDIVRRWDNSSTVVQTFVDLTRERVQRDLVIQPHLA